MNTERIEFLNRRTREGGAMKNLSQIFINHPHAAPVRPR